MRDPGFVRRWGAPRGSRVWPFHDSLGMTIGGGALALERTCASVGYPKAIRVDPGSEFISRDLGLWAHSKGVTLDYRARYARVHEADSSSK